MRIAIVLGALGLLAVPVLAGLAPQENVKPGAKVPAFTATAVSVVDSVNVQVPTAYMIVGVNCGATPAYEKRFKAIEDEFRSKGVDFYWVFPNKTETLEAKQAWMRKVGLKGGMIDDVGAKITKSLEVPNTAHVILTDKDGTVVYRGGIDDNRDPEAVEHRYLAEAIQAVLAGKPVATKTSRAFG